MGYTLCDNWLTTRIDMHLQSKVFLAYWMGHLLPDRPALEAGQFSRQILREKDFIDQIKTTNVLKVVFFGLAKLWK